MAEGRRKLWDLFNQVSNSIYEQPREDPPPDAILQGIASARELGGHQSRCVTVTASESPGIEKEKGISRETYLVGVRTPPL